MTALITSELQTIWKDGYGSMKQDLIYSKRPVKLKYYETTNDIKQAIVREKQLKGWSRKKKQAIFKEDWEELKRLSKSYSLKTNSYSASAPSTSSG